MKLPDGPLPLACPRSYLPSSSIRPSGSLSHSLALSSLTGREVLTPFPGLGTATAPAQGGAHLKQCDLLKLSRRQKQLCRREPGLAETLQDAAHLSLLECQFQFRHERWNCSLEGRTGLLKRGREEGWERRAGEREGLGVGGLEGVSFPVPLASGPRPCCLCKPSMVLVRRVLGLGSPLVWGEVVQKSERDTEKEEAQPIPGSWRSPQMRWVVPQSHSLSLQRTHRNTGTHVCTPNKVEERIRMEGRQ